MRMLILLAGLGLGLSYCSPSAYAQKKGGWRDLIKKAEDQLGTKGSASSFSNKEAVAALKEALEIGAKNASGELSRQNGFFGNNLIKILLPPEAKQVESTLRGIGMGHYVDEAILAMNRAAEDASSKAVPIFVSAIKTMSVQDGISIVKNGEGAATRY